MNTNILEQFQSLLQKLQQEKADHQKAIDEIDQVLSQMSPSPPPTHISVPQSAEMTTETRKARRGPKPGKQGTAADAVLEFIRSNGRTPVSSAQINDFWKKSGRPGSAYVTISKLARDKMLKKHDVEGVRGSAYTAREG